MPKTTQKPGQVAIMLVLILVLLITISTAAVAIGVSTSRDTTSLALGAESKMIATSGAENAILHLLRDQSYIGETNLPIGGGSATITVTGTSPKTITSTATLGSMVRKVEVIVTIENGKLTVTSWREL